MTTANAKKTNAKADSTKMEVKKKETSKVNDVLSLEKRIQKVEELNIVIDKWRKLGEAKKNLTGFKLGSDGLWIFRSKLTPFQRSYKKRIFL